MTNAENFDADVEQGADEEFSDAPAEEAGAAPAEAPAAPKKSGGGLVKVLLLLVVAGLGGAAGAVKMGLIESPIPIPGLTPPVTAAATPLPAPKPAAAAAVEAPVKPVQVAQAGMPAPVSGPDASPPPQSAMPGISPQSGEAGLPSPTLTAPTPAVPAPAPAAANGISAPTPALTPPTPELTAPTPAAAPSLAPPDAGKPSAPPAIAAPPPPVEAAAPPAVGNPEEAGKIQKLDDRITALEQGIGDLKGNAVSKSDVDALKASIDKLQADVEELKKNPPVAASSGAAPAAMPAKKHGRMKAAAAPAAPAEGAPKAASVHHGHHHAHTMTATAPAKVESGSWVLKSAKPGMAWISEPGSAEIRSVSVGETLKGVGKVTSISQDESGHWVVNGTHGKINQ